MTNKEAKEVIQNHLNHWERLYREKICTEEEGKKTIAAFEVAIKALEAQFRHADIAEATAETAKLLEEGYFERRLLGGADVLKNRTSDIDEVIKALEYDGFSACKETSYQIAQWLKELKRLKEKEEPKKVLVSKNAYGWELYHCPLGEDGLYDYMKFDHCTNCGQALEWEEKE